MKYFAHLETPVCKTAQMFGHKLQSYHIFRTEVAQILRKPLNILRDLLPNETCRGAEVARVQRVAIEKSW